MKRHLAMFLAVVMVLSLVACGESGTEPQGSSSPTSSTEPSEHHGAETPTAPDDVEKTDEGDTQTNSNPQNDTDVGLKVIKIDTAGQELTEDQKAVVAYFDDDYLSVPSYEFLRRYPKVFQDAQLSVWGTVKKVISMDNDQYKLILWNDVGPAEYEYSYEHPEYEGQYLVLTGQTGDAWYMEGDTLKVYGRYTGVETVEVDGTSYTIPAVQAHSAYFDTSQAPNDIFRYIPKFDLPFVKQVAETIFGDDIEVRQPIAGIDIHEAQEGLWLDHCGTYPCFLVELENQSNAKFTKFLFYTASDLGPYGGYRIADAKDALSLVSSGISRNIEFSADFEHFFLFTYDTNLEMLSLEYYDRDLNKIWEREFDQTTSAIYDYTENNIYMVANNELYIINTETGEDTFAPTYVGEKVAIRKMDDGVLMIAKNKSDGIMKSGLDGNIVWKTNLANDVHSATGLQIKEDGIVFEQYYWNSPEDYGTHFVLVDGDTGEILVDAKAIT